MSITLTALKEKVRKKELYIVSAIGIILILMFGTGSGSITIAGKAVTDYQMLAPILLIVVNGFCCILAAIMSLSTIPNEYDRHTSHLVWIRKIPQSRYHGELALANMLSGLISEAILFCAVFIFMLIYGKAADAWRLIPAYLIMGVNVAAVSVMTSAVCIVIARFAAGAISITATVMGIFYSLLLTLSVTRDDQTGETRLSGWDYTPIYTVMEERDGLPMQVLRLENAIAMYENQYITGISEATYKNMKLALEKITQRISPEE